jgi:hypothetical protein
VRWLLVALAIVGASLLSGGIAGAAAQTAQGDFTVSPPVVTSVQPTEDGGCVIELEATFSLTGTLEGVIPFHFVVRQDAPCDQAARERFKATGTFTGTVAGVSGTFAATFHGTIDGPNAQGKLTIHDGAGGLSDLHGHLTLTGTTGCCGTYTGRVDVAR